MQQIKNLSVFQSDVLSRGVEAVLPINLNDSWLEHLLDQAELFVAQDKNAKPAEVIAAISTILLYRADNKPISCDLSELIKYVHLYAIELTIEAMNRSCDKEIIRPTLQNILTDREIAYR